MNNVVRRALAGLGGAPAAPCGRRMLVFTHGYPPLQTSGAEAQIHRKVRWWKARGHTVEVVAADPQPPAMGFDKLETSSEWVDGVQVHRLRFAAPDASRPLAETFEPALLAPAVEQQLRAFQPDLVYQVSGYLFGVLPVRQAVCAGVPVVLFAMDYWHECQRGTLLRPDGVCCGGPRSAADCAACRLTARRLGGLGGSRFTGDLWRLAARAGGAGIPVISSTLGVTAFQERERAVSETLALTDLVVVNSAFLARRLTQLGVPEMRQLVIRQGLESGELAAARGPGRDWDELRVLYLGQLTRHKGVDLLIEAVEQVSDEGIAVQLSLHGPLTEPGYAEQLRRYRHPAVTVGDPLPRAQLAGALAAHDVLVVPSRWYENSPNVILEAFSAGVPVIAANHGGMAEMVRHQVDGLLFQPSDAESLAAALRRLVRRPELLQQLRAGVVAPYGMDTEMDAEELAIDAMLARRAAAVHA